jgi:gas vesicle protein
MYNKKVIIGVAAGVAVLAIAGLLLVKRNKSKKQKMMDRADGLADTFKSKLHNLQRKAQKEIKHAADRGEEFTNVARDRAADWIGKVNPS